jgi:HD-GYP domain-containing protein (c-di-GMP phosphodiesterase class II)
MERLVQREETSGDAGRAVWNAAPASAWEVLERFGQSLHQCRHSRQQITLVLESMSASLRADTVFWHPGGDNDAVEAHGGVVLDSAWYRDFTALLLREESDNPPTVLRHRLHLGTDVPAGPVPRSAALVRISRTHQSWLGAISFSARHLLDSSDLKVMLLARRMLLNHRRQAQAFAQLRESLFGLVRCLTAAIDAKDPYTCGHSERVGRIAVRLGEQMQLPPAVLSDLYLAGLLHDIGKIGVPDSVLRRDGPLTEEEHRHVQEHAALGEQLVSAVAPLAHLRPAVRHHHERIDGTGYPDGLAGEAIPLVARILAVADACDAMMTARPHRPALAPEQIETLIAAGAGTQWDATVVKHFLACRHELCSICQCGLGLSVVEALDHVLERTEMLDSSVRPGVEAAC